MSKYEEWVDGLLGKDDLPKREPTELERQMDNIPWWQSPEMYLLLGIALGIEAFVFDSPPLLFWTAIIGAVVGIVLWVKLSQHRLQYHQVKANQREDDLAFARKVYEKRLEAQPVNLATLTNGDIERMRAEGTLHALNLAQLQNERHIQLTQDEADKVRQHEAAMAKAGYTHESAEARAQRVHDEAEAKRAREHDSRERERDRQLTIDQLITKFEGQIREIETRMSFERPDAHFKSQQELIRLRARMLQLEEINKLRLTNPILHRQLFDDWKRGYV